MIKSIKKMLSAAAGEERTEEMVRRILNLQVGDKVIISRVDAMTYRSALVRKGKTELAFVGSFREVFESAMQMADPDTLDGVRVVRKEPGGVKVY